MTLCQKLAPYLEGLLHSIGHSTPIKGQHSLFIAPHKWRRKACHIPGGYNSRSPINQSKVRDTKNANQSSETNLQSAVQSQSPGSDTQSEFRVRSPGPRSKVQYQRSPGSRSRVQEQETWMPAKVLTPCFHEVSGFTEACFILKQLLELLESSLFC